MVASGLAAPLPGVPVRALISTRTMIAIATIQKTSPDFPTVSPARWLADPMKNSIGMDMTTLVREARPPRAPAAAAAGFAGFPAAVSISFLMTTLFLGQ